MYHDTCPQQQVKPCSALLIFLSLEHVGNAFLHNLGMRNLHHQEIGNSRHCNLRQHLEPDTLKGHGCKTSDSHRHK